SLPARSTTRRSGGRARPPAPATGAAARAAGERPLFRSLRSARRLHSFPTRRSSDLVETGAHVGAGATVLQGLVVGAGAVDQPLRSEEHTSELQSLAYLVCRLLLEKKKPRAPASSRAGRTRHGLPAAELARRRSEPSR